MPQDGEGCGGGVVKVVLVGRPRIRVRYYAAQAEALVPDRLTSAVTEAEVRLSMEQARALIVGLWRQLPPHERPEVFP